MEGCQLPSWLCVCVSVCESVRVWVGGMGVGVSLCCCGVYCGGSPCESVRGG